MYKVSVRAAASSIASGTPSKRRQISPTVNGYTDNTGSEGINIPLSAQRAKIVADYLVARGVAGDHIATVGLGSVNPIASNATPEGRAKNRRVEIVVN